MLKSLATAHVNDQLSRLSRIDIGQDQSEAPTEGQFWFHLACAIKALEYDRLRNLAGLMHRPQRPLPQKSSRWQDNSMLAKLFRGRLKACR